jgi:hypothetical protein
MRLSGRYFVIAVSTCTFTRDGREVVGISTPDFGQSKDHGAGESGELSRRKLVIEDVAWRGSSPRRRRRRAAIQFKAWHTVQD